MSRDRDRIKVAVRKTIESGGSLLITLPKQFCREHELRRGDELVFIYNGELLIKPRPVRAIEEIEALKDQIKD